MWRDDKGLTLVETVVAVALLAAVLIPLFNMFYTGIRGYTAAAEETILVNLAQGKIEELKAEDYDTLTDQGPTVFPEFAEYMYEVEVLEIDPEKKIKQITVSAYSLEEPNRRVRLVTWVTER
ncbi:prepilin-type N-terminal cleavage/methylation domain-containing protein [Calderihabitans maritimus]|uniref:Prepilin-type N-terminal cleavage/methylation domain-containing protein n=1 Tax=Calderihabitans maritimus TaxID=1246530 RepID=A0A1Z5HX81_9FIRM|nr:prepilin-type N-terminal cleavage/methylation domain-containing protein [Calderihabitans maritimus]GAW94136.1 hypothetical protein Toce_1925 [Calderihabitans maritimus]